MSSSSSLYDNLFPAVVECFAVILLGYIAGRFNIVSTSQGIGIGKFISYFALPAVLFKSMCEMDFSGVNWPFLASIFVAKTILFATVGLITAIINRPFNWGLIALYSIFVTQSNDFALGYPILQSIYQDSHKEYLQYIYLVAPISLVFLNPLGFVFMEIEKRRSELKTPRSIEGSPSDTESATTSNNNTPTTSSSSSDRGYGKLVLTVVKGVVLNPIVFMTVIGVIGNFIFSHKVPFILDDILIVLGSAFNGSALFYLGLNMVGKIQRMTGVALIVPILLIIAKSLVAPLVTREAVTWLLTAQDDNTTSSLAMFGFLYGTFPPAPTVFIYAAQYGIAETTISSGLVLGTVLSAPLMFFSARMISLPLSSAADLQVLVEDTSYIASIVSLLCAIWIIFLFILSRRFFSYPHQLTVGFLCYHMLACIGMILWRQIGVDCDWKHYVQFIIFLIGVIGTRCWTVGLAFAIAVIRLKGSRALKQMRIGMHVAVFSVAGISTGIVLVSGNGKRDPSDPSIQYQTAQLAVSMVVLFLCLAATIMILIYMMRRDRQFWHRIMTRVSTEKKNDDDVPVAGNTSVNALDNSTRNDQEEALVSPTMSSSYSAATPEEYDDHAGDELVVERQKDHQIIRHLVFILLCLFSIVIGFAMCFWRLMNETQEGVYLELEFIDAAFNFGQGVMAFAVFGFDTKYIINPFVKRWRRFWYGTETVIVPPYTSLDTQVRQTCEQFRLYHMEQCCRDIVRDRRYRLRVYPQVFTGGELVTWFITVGLVRDRSDGIIYGSNLLLGNVLHHVTREHHFHDMPYYYRFTDSGTQLEDRASK